jgi:hypothetical protein
MMRNKGDLSMTDDWSYSVFFGLNLDCILSYLDREIKFATFIHNRTFDSLVDLSSGCEMHVAD